MVQILQKLLHILNKDQKRKVAGLGGCAGLLADDLAQNGPLVGFDDVAVAVEHLADNVRL